MQETLTNVELFIIPAKSQLTAHGSLGVRAEPDAKLALCKLTSLVGFVHPRGHKAFRCHTQSKHPVKLQIVQTFCGMRYFSERKVLHSCTSEKYQVRHPVSGAISHYIVSSESCIHVLESGTPL